MSVKRLSVKRPGAPGTLPVMKSRDDIQGLRALAVLLVALGHAGLLGLTGGYVGVDVFFVISGFLISSILLHEATARGSLSLLGFYAKRAKRILPAATVTLLATAVTATVILPYVRAESILKDVAWATFFAANIHFGQVRTDYFAPSLPPSPVQHYWSLAVEEQFYLVWPAVIVLVIVVGARRSPVAVCRRLPWLAVTVAAVSAASLVWSVISTRSDPTSAYFATPSRVWELGAGALLALAGRRLERLAPRARRALAWLGLACVLTAAFSFTASTPVPGYHMVLPVAGTVMLLAAGSGIAGSPAPIVVRLLGRQPLRWIGDVSYGFYLWHWPFLILGAAYLGHRLDWRETVPLLGAALVMAWLSYILLENPLREARVWARRPRLAVVLWPVALATLLAVNVTAHTYIDVERARVAAAAAHVDLSALPPAERAHRDANPVHNQIADSIDRATLHAPQAPVHLEKIGPWLRRQDCGATKHGVRQHICVLGDVDGARRMVVFGDSHSLMWLSALQPIAQRSGYQLIPVTKLGCTPYQVVAWRFDRHSEYTACNKWRSWAIGEIARLHSDVVVVGSASVMESTNASTGRLLPRAQAERAWSSGARATARKLIAVTPRVRFLQDINLLPWDPAECLSDLSHNAADCTFAPSGEVTRSDHLVRTGIAGTGASYVRLRDLFCMQNECPTVIDGIEVYSDNDHVARAYARHLAGELAPRLRLPS